MLVYTLYQNVCFRRACLHLVLLTAPDNPLSYCAGLQEFELFWTRAIFKLVWLSFVSIWSATVHFRSFGRVEMNSDSCAHTLFGHYWNVCFSFLLFRLVRQICFFVSGCDLFLSIVVVQNTDGPFCVAFFYRVRLRSEMGIPTLRIGMGTISKIHRLYVVQSSTRIDTEPIFLFFPHPPLSRAG